MAQNDKPQCHFISNTHWDREWRYSMQRTRHMLVYMMDMLLDILEKEPEFHSFHMDSQSIPIQDYLEIRPEKEGLIRKVVKEERLLVGPWFVLPDEFCVAGESIIRNLLLGHRIARDLGAVSKTGYSPFSWGQISQMPQIYRGFGIPFAAFYRGINTLVAPNSEFIWEGPDGSRLVGSRLAARPRYNVWYVIQRPAYWNLEDENERLMSWKTGHGPFRMADSEFCELDAQYVHPRFEYFAENVPDRAKQALEEQDGEWTTPHRFWSAGHDSSCPDIREVRLIRDSRDALGDGADVFHSTFAAFQKAVCENVTDDLPVAHGEMRHYFTPGSSSVLFAWIISAHMEIKQDNYVTERALTDYAEPMAVCASLLGAPYPRSFVNLAWNWLLQNHGHDSIGACSRDVVPEDMLFRSKQSREISGCVLERALMDIAGSIDLSDRSAEDVALVAWNPLPYADSPVSEIHLEIPEELNAQDFDIVDENGKKILLQKGSLQSGAYRLVQSPNDTANVFAMNKHHVFAQLPGVPGTGYKTFFVQPKDKIREAKKTMVTGPQTMENDHLSVSIGNNGTLTIQHKKTGHQWTGLGYFRDSSETGNPWEHHPVACDSVFTTLNERARVILEREGELVTTFRVEIDWVLPAKRSEDEMGRSEERVPCAIVNRITLRKGEPWVEIETELDNQAEDHYLQVSFPTGLGSDTVMAQIPFDVVARPVAMPDPAPFGEEPQTEFPMDRFVDLSDGKIGAALLNEGLKAYEPHNDEANTISLTLLRCFPLRICVTALEMTDFSKLDKGSQCLGKHTFRYAFLPHEGDWKDANLWHASERFTHPLRIAQMGPTPEGTESKSKSFLELEPEGLHLSALKESEDGKGWVVRLFNPGDDTVNGKMRLNLGQANPKDNPSLVERQAANFALPAVNGKAWSKVEKVSLEEIMEEELSLDKDGWLSFEMGKKKLLTIKFTP